MLKRRKKGQYERSGKKRGNYKAETPFEKTNLSWTKALLLFAVEGDDWITTTRIKQVIPDATWKNEIQPLFLQQHFIEKDTKTKLQCNRKQFRNKDYWEKLLNYIQKSLIRDIKHHPYYSFAESIQHFRKERKLQTSSADVVRYLYSEPRAKLRLLRYNISIDLAMHLDRIEKFFADSKNKLWLKKQLQKYFLALLGLPTTGQISIANIIENFIEIIKSKKPDNYDFYSLAVKHSLLVFTDINMLASSYAIDERSIEEFEMELTKYNKKQEVKNAKNIYRRHKR